MTRFLMMTTALGGLVAATALNASPAAIVQGEARPDFPVPEVCERHARYAQEDQVTVTNNQSPSIVHSTDEASDFG